MKRILALALCLAPAFAWAQTTLSYTSTNNTPFSITVAGSPTCGTYWDGSPWCVGPVTVTAFGGRLNNGGIEINPGALANTNGGLVPGYGFHDASKNRASSLPSLVVQPNNSVVGVALWNTNPPCQDTGKTTCVRAAAVLTVVSSAPPGGGATCLRPSMSTTTKVHRCNLDFSSVPSFPEVAASTRLDEFGSLATVADLVGTPIPNFYVNNYSPGSENFNLFVPRPSSGYNRTQNSGFRNLVWAAIRILGTESKAVNSARWRALMAWAQYGIEMADSARPKGQGGNNMMPGIDNCYWTGAQQIAGAYLPMLIGVTLANDQELRTFVRGIAGTEKKYCFHETQQVARLAPGRPAVVGDKRPFRPDGQTIKPPYSASIDGKHATLSAQLRWYWGQYVGTKLGTISQDHRDRGSVGDPYGYIDGPGAAQQMVGYMRQVPHMLAAIGLLLRKWPELANTYNHDALQEHAGRYATQNGGLTYRPVNKANGWGDVCAEPPAGTTCPSSYSIGTVQQYPYACSGWGVTWGDNGSGLDCIHGNGRTTGTVTGYLTGTPADSVRQWIPDVYEHVWDAWIASSGTSPPPDPGDPGDPDPPPPAGNVEYVDGKVTILNDDGGTPITDNGCNCDPTGNTPCASTTGVSWTQQGLLANNSFSATWSETEPRRCGQFNDNSFWVLGPIELDSFTGSGFSTFTGSFTSAGGQSLQKSMFNGGSCGAMINPQQGTRVNNAPTLVQGMMSGVGNYTTAERLTFPAMIPAHSSVVTCVYETSHIRANGEDVYANDTRVGISNPGNCHINATVGWQCVQMYGAITVVHEIPPNNGANVFRPGLSETPTKTFYTEDQIDYGRVPSHAAVTANANRMSLANVRTMWSHPFPDLYTPTIGDQGRSMTPVDQMGTLEGGYGAAMSRDLGTSLISVMGSETQAQKKAAINALIQSGIDIYSAYSKGASWPPGAGQNHGRYGRMLFFAAMTTVAAVRAAALSAAGPDYMRWHELGQVGGPSMLYGDSAGNIANTGLGVCSGPNHFLAMVNAQCYAGAAGTCNVSVSREQNQCKDPYGKIDGSGIRPASSYQSIGMGPFQALVLAMKMMPALQAVHGQTYFSQYFTDRYTDHPNSRYSAKTAPDNCAPPPPNPGCSNLTSASQLSTCTNYGVTWGHNASTGTCFAGSGRFGALTGGIGAPYRSNLAYALWPSFF